MKRISFSEAIDEKISVSFKLQKEVKESLDTLSKDCNLSQTKLVESAILLLANPSKQNWQEWQKIYFKAYPKTKKIKTTAADAEVEISSGETSGEKIPGRLKFLKPPIPVWIDNQEWTAEKITSTKVTIKFNEDCKILDYNDFTETLKNDVRNKEYFES